MAKKKEVVAKTTDSKVDNTPKAESVETKNIEKPSWEIKDRFYYLRGNRSPLTLRLKAKGIYYFDEDKGYERELLYTRNQKTCFVDEMSGEKHLAQIVFTNGGLVVPKNLQNLQKMLSIYHPAKNKVYLERDDVAEAQDEIVDIHLELEAMNTAMTLDIDQAEAIMRTEIGSKVDSVSSKELKRDLLIFAKSNPSLFLELVNDDNVSLRNLGIKATECGILKLSQDNRTFSWGSNDRKLMTVPFDEHPYSALAAWFKTDEGMNVLSSIEKKMK